jgi:hypothetical protein
MEKQYKLAYPKSIVVDTLYHTHVPIALIAWAQKEHTDLITDHDWPDLTAKLPESNTASMYSATSTVVEHSGTFVENRTCHHCNEKGHIRPYYPKLTNCRNEEGHVPVLLLKKRRPMPRLPNLWPPGSTLSLKTSPYLIQTRMVRLGNFALNASARSRTRQEFSSLVTLTLNTLIISDH